MALFRLGKEFRPQAFVDGSLAPEQMRFTVRGQPEVARRNPAAGFIPARDFDPFSEALPSDVRGPGVKETAEVIVPLLACQLTLEIAPCQVRLDDVTDSEEMNGASPQ